MPVDVTQLPLPRWEVELHGEDRDLDYLVRYFTVSPRIYRDSKTGQTLMLVEGCADDAAYSTVSAAADDGVKVLSGTLKMLYQSHKPLRVGGVMHRQLDGRCHVYLEARSILGVVTFGDAEVLVSGADGQRMSVPQGPPPAVLLVALAQTDLTVAKAMRLAAMPDAETWRGLVPLFEVIEHDVMRQGASVVKKGWTSKTQQKRFEHTANSSAAGDASRHGHERYSPPANPMTLEEARAFVQMVLHAWIADRLAQAATTCNNPGNP